MSAGLLERAFTSAITLGILAAYVLGKPIGVVSSAIVSLRLRVGSRALTTPAIVGVGAVAGVGFTVSLLISSLAFRGQALQEAKVGVLTSALAATALSWLVFRLIARLPKATRARQMAGTLEEIMDLSEDVDPERDHIRGGHGAPVTLVEYGDYEWPLLWPGRACRPRTAPLVWRRPSLRVAPPAPSRGASPRADRRGGGRGGREPRRILGDARQAHHPPGRAHSIRPGSLRRGARARRKALLNCGKRRTPIASPRMSPAPMPAESPAFLGSLSTGSGKTADTTSPRSRPGCGQHAIALPPPGTGDAPAPSRQQADVARRLGRGHAWPVSRSPAGPES